MSMRERMSSVGMSVSDPAHRRPVYREKRRCRDVPWLVVFLLFTLGMGLVSYIAIRFGDIRRIQFGRDSEGNLCGVKAGDDSARDLIGQEWLYFFNLSEIQTYRRCIRSCPTNFTTIVCNYNTTAGPANSSQLLSQIANGTCVRSIPTRPYQGRCIPDGANFGTTLRLSSNDIKAYSQTINADFGSSVTSLLYREISERWFVLACSAGFTFVLGGLWLFFMLLASGSLVWVTIIGLLLSIWLITGFCVYNYVQITLTSSVTSLSVSTGFETIDAAINNQTLFLALMIIFGVAAIGLTIYIIVSRQSIRLSVGIIRETSRFFQSVPTIILFPITKIVLVFAVTAFSLYIFILVTTAGSTVSANLSYTISGASSIVSNAKVFVPTIPPMYLQIYVGLWFFWTWNAVRVFGNATVSGSVGYWYWNHTLSGRKQMIVLRSLGKILTYHLGSMVLGPLLIGAVMIIRSILFLISPSFQKAERLEEARGRTTATDKCLGAMDNFVQMIGSFGYVAVAIGGKTFVRGSSQAYGLIKRNQSRIKSVESISLLLHIVGLFSSIFLTIIASIVLLTRFYPDTPWSNFSILLIVIFALSYTISSCFIPTFTFAIDTMIFSYCQDCEINDGSKEKPYVMNPQMRDFMEETHGSRENLAEHFANVP